MRRCVGIARVFAGILSVMAAPALALPVIDFEDWTGGGGYQDTVVSHGYDFHGSLYVSPHPETNNSTNCLYSSISQGCKFGLGGLPFSITSLDLQEGFGASDTILVKLVGYHPGGWGVQQTFTLDGLVSTFETFYPVGFSDVDQVNLYSYNTQGQYSAAGFSIDNIVIVPEPGMLGLVLPGLMGFGRRRR